MRVGDVLDGRWEVRGYLGRGAMGVVHRGFDRRLGIDVAIKVMAPDFARQDPSTAQRFQDEARKMSKVGHPNVVRVYDVNTTSAGEM